MEIHPAETSERKNDNENVIQRLTSTIREGAQKAKSLSSACIYRVPKKPRKMNESAYTPQCIAIGPLHRNDPHLQTPMQHVKMSYMNNLFCRITKEMEIQEAEQKKILQDCVAAMEMSIEDAKNCYAEEVTVNVEMMLVDGCFILELLYRLRLHYSDFYSEGLYMDDPIFRNDATIVDVQKDLLILENQIPFLVLERLFTLTLARIRESSKILGKSLSLTDYVYLPQVEYLMHPVEGQSTSSTGSVKTSWWPRDCILSVLANKSNNSKPEEKVPSEKEVPKPSDFGHILHKLHHDFRPQDQTVGRGGLYGLYLPSASELVYAGVKFVPATGNDLFNVKFTEPEGPFWWFRSARFEIPSIHAQRTTELVLRNFIAFEQCCACPGISHHFTSYAYLMERLMNSGTDVQVLENVGVIQSILGAPEAALDIFSKLFKNCAISEFYFADACNRATMYSKCFWPKNMAYLRSQYFASPWKFIAFCLGFVYFGLTIAQLIVSIYIK